MRFLFAVILNGVVINLAGFLHSQRLLSWPLGALVIVGLFVFVPRSLIRAADVGKASSSDPVIIKNGLAWVLGGFLPMQVAYSIVVRPTGLMLTLLAVFHFFVGGAIAGFFGWGFSQTFRRQGRQEP